MGVFRRWTLLAIIFAVILIGFVLVRATGSKPIGPAVALCPGPDGFGYVCDFGADIPYIDASVDTLLYSDDDLVEVTLPFSFAFYGREYSVARVSSNGNVQLTTSNPSFVNTCLSPEPVQDMGDMIAPYWTDLDLTFDGYLETEVSGVAPDRVFVIEWDNVPYYGTLGERATFEVQLFENGQIAFLYETVNTQTVGLGNDATIGLQSGAQGLALQVGCNQFAVGSNQVVLFYNEAEAPLSNLAKVNPRTSSWSTATEAVGIKGDLDKLISILNRRGLEGLREFRALTRYQSPPQGFDWRRADLDGDREYELIVLWEGPSGEGQQARLVILDNSGDGGWTIDLDRWPLAREEVSESLELFAVSDVTGNGVRDLVLRSDMGTFVAVVSVIDGRYEIYTLDDRCPGDLLVEPRGEEGISWLVRQSCRGQPQPYRWDGQGFSSIRN